MIVEPKESQPRSRMHVRLSTGHCEIGGDKGLEPRNMLLRRTSVHSLGSKNILLVKHM